MRGHIQKNCPSFTVRLGHFSTASGTFENCNLTNSYERKIKYYVAYSIIDISIIKSC